jgi:hypothetical protein
VFNALLEVSPYFVNSVEDGGLGGRMRMSGRNVFTGFRPYNIGETDVHAGFRLLGEFEFSATVDYITVMYDAAGNETGRQSNFPNWWEVDFWNFEPSPLHHLAPGCTIEDTGNGVRIAGPWGLDLLRSTIDNGSAGHRYTPRVTAGPYRFVHYSESDSLVSLTVNPYFIGNYAGYKPMIEHIFMRQVESRFQPEEFMSGNVDMVVNASSGAVINALLDFSEGGVAQYINFPRNGYGFVDIKHHAPRPRLDTRP